MYNPFVPITETLFRQLLQEGYLFFVVQRFDWPLLERGKGFMVSPYSQQDDAVQHAAQLAAKEGKLLDVREDRNKLLQLVAKGSGYRLFLNKFREDHWKARMMRLYKDKIIGYLRARTSFTSRDTIDINITLELGRVMAVISNGERTITVKAIDLIN